MSELILNNDKARIKSAAKRRLKSGRRAHFSLGNSAPSYKTVSGDTFTGKPKDDEHIPAAGKVRFVSWCLALYLIFPQKSASIEHSYRCQKT